MTDADLVSLEKKFQHAYDKDGALETLAGIGLFVGGAILNHVIGTFIAWFPILLVFLGKAWKRKITYPRVGYAKLAAVKQTKKSALILVSITVLMVAMTAVLSYVSSKSVGADKSASVEPYTGVAMGAFVSFLIAGMGFVRHTPTLYAGAALLFALILSAAAGCMTNGDALTITGILLFIVGIIRLILFIRANPRLDGEVSRE